MIDRNKLSLRVALSLLANIAFADRTHSRAKPCFASSAARQFVSRQGGCPAKKLRVRGLVAAHLFTKNPRSGEPIPTRPVTAKASMTRGPLSTQIVRPRKVTGTRAGAAR